MRNMQKTAYINEYLLTNKLHQYIAYDYDCFYVTANSPVAIWLPCEIQLSWKSPFVKLCGNACNVVSIC